MFSAVFVVTSDVWKAVSYIVGDDVFDSLIHWNWCVIIWKAVSGVLVLLLDLYLVVSIDNLKESLLTYQCVNVNKKHLLV